MQESFIVSARKYRPESWETVVGQDSITSTLQNAISNNHIAQAYLFCGPRGVGKTTCARIFAKEINLSEGEAISNLDFNMFELDAASNNGVDDIKNITDQVRIPPQTGKYKVYIIDEVHMLSQAAFNAFLKTLEEPPAHAIFILATTEKHKIIPTILSRCQIFDFKRIGVSDIASHLAFVAEKEGVKADHEALHIIAQKADGALRDALSIFDQVVAFSGKDITYESVVENLNVLDYEYYFRMTDHLLVEDIKGSLLLLNEILHKGFDGHHLVTGLGEHYRNLMVAKDAETIGLLEVSDSVKSRYKEQASKAEIPWLVQTLEFITQCDLNYRASKNQRLSVELMLMQIGSIPYNLKEEKKKSRFRLKPPSSAPIKITKPVVEKELDVSQKKFEERKDLLERMSAPSTFKNPRKTFATKERVSIKTMLNVDSGQNAVVEEDSLSFDLPREEFTSDQLKKHWKTISLKMKEDHGMDLFSTMNSHFPEIMESGELKMRLHNSVQVHSVNKVKAELVEFLRDNLNNHSITVRTELLEDDSPVERKVGHMTDKEKYEHFAEINPELHKLREQLGLTTES